MTVLLFYTITHDVCLAIDFCTSQTLHDVAVGRVQSVQLTHRSLLRVCGVDSGTFLQGLVTADVGTLGEQRSLYSMILNAQVP